MHIPQLTFTRFLASISIVVLHFGLFTWPINSSPFSNFQTELASAVSYFFVLSGFIMVIASVKKTGKLPNEIACKGFWLRRISRLMPVYLFTIIVFFAINFRYDPSIPLEWQIQSYYYSLFLLQSWKYRMALDINYPAWSLSVEAFFYLIFPWLYSQFVALTNKRLIIVATLSWILNIYIFISLKNEGVPENFVKFFPLLHLATFMFGVCSGILFIRNYEWFTGKGRKLIIAITCMVGLFVLYTSYKNYDFYQYQHNGMLAPFFVLIFYSLSIMKGPIVTLLASKPFVFLGAISYSVYILQYPVYQVCQKYIPWFAGKEPADIFYAYVIVLLTVSTATYYWLEKPARSYLNKQFSR